MEMRDQILACAQKLVQQRGFNGFSYADIAQEVGIRKASIHHYFPTKADLGVAMVQCYAAFMETMLGQISVSQSTAAGRLQAYISLYQGALASDRACLGGMLAAESLTLDAAMLPSLRQLFTRNVDWLTEVLVEGKSRGEVCLAGPAAEYARLFLSTLQGALLLARATGDHALLSQSGALLLAGLK